MTSPPDPPVRPLIEELDRQATPIGEISLRRRLELTLQVDVWEARLDEEYLMSSLFTVAEEELARLTLATMGEATGLDVVVGGLGLGYTAQAALADERIGSLVVVEALAPVISWHERRLLPCSPDLVEDPRCTLAQGDFFALTATDGAYGVLAGAVDVLLVDIDHTPRNTLDPSHAWLYEPDGLRRVAARLRPGGAFGLWSDDPPDEPFVEALSGAFTDVAAHVVTFPNPFTDEPSANTVYVATVARDA